MLIRLPAESRLASGFDPDTLKVVIRMDINKKVYIPALNKEWLTQLYDPFLRYVMQEQGFKQRLVELASPQPGQRILDIGCGTGTLTVMLKHAQPAATVIGLDGDEAVLAIARKKAALDDGNAIIWQLGYSYDLPYPDASFDLVLASMMLHHLTRENKRATFREARRVLKPGSRFWMVDFGQPHDALMRMVASFVSQFEQTKDHFRGILPGLLLEAGFNNVKEIETMRRLAGPLSIYCAR